MRIVAYIVVNGGEDLTVSEVRRYLRASLPDYMIPSFVMTLQSLPLTANGKLDRGALPDVFRSVGDDVALSEPPAPGMEQLLADIWRETLRVDKVNAGDNFFDLGGHSLLAIRVAVALQKQIGWRLDPRSLFFQTLRQVAAQAEAAVTRPPAEPRHESHARRRLPSLCFRADWAHLRQAQKYAMSALRCMISHRFFRMAPHEFPVNDPKRPHVFGRNRPS